MLNEAGVLADSVRYFHTPEPFAAANLLSGERAGDYHCDRNYSFFRQASDVRTCQLILVTEGELTLQYQELTFIAKAGQLIAMQLGQQQCYYTSSDQLRMLWLHFDGPAACAYIEEINRVNGLVFSVVSNPDIERDLRHIIGSFRKGFSDDLQYSLQLQQLLNSLCRPLDIRKHDGIRLTIDQAIAYMEANYSDSNLSLDELTSHFTVSKSYFLRKFKELEGCSPHQYLLSVRIRIAKQMLDTTSESIESIAEKCGFYSSSHFITYFHRTTGMTPLSFRQLWR